jgi:hypothetical protein
MMLGLAGVGHAVLCAVNPALPDVLALTFMATNPTTVAQDQPGAVSPVEPLR